MEDLDIKDYLKWYVTTFTRMYCSYLQKYILLHAMAFQDKISLQIGLQHFIMLFGPHG